MQRVSMETRQEYLNFENSFIHHFHIEHNALNELCIWKRIPILILIIGFP